MLLGILVAGHIDDSHKEQYVNYAYMFKQLFEKVGEDFEYQVFNVCDDHWPNLIDSCDAWLITGSASGVYENKPWMMKLKKWIIHVYEHGMPMVGICFGHQIIAEAFAGKVEKFPGGWSVGPQTYNLKHLSLENKQTLTLNAVHQDQVMVKPHNAECVGNSDFCNYAMLMYGKQILTIQAHPEFTREYERDLLELHKGQAVELARAQQALELIKQDELEMDDLVVARWMAQVLKGGRD